MKEIGIGKQRKKTTEGSRKEEEEKNMCSYPSPSSEFNGVRSQWSRDFLGSIILVEMSGNAKKRDGEK